MSFVTKKTIVRALPIVGYIALIVLVFGSVLLPGSSKIVFGDDVQRQYYFYREFFNTFFRQGLIPWWNPYFFSGTPFIANPVVNMLYPPTWLFVFLPLSFAYSLHLALHILVAMCGMYWLAKQHVSKIAAWLSGAIYGLSGFFMARVWAGHVDVIAAASYMPVVFGLYWLVVKRGTRKDISLAAFAFALQLFAGYQTMAFFTGISIGVAMLVYATVHRAIKPIGRVLFTTCIAVCLSAVQLLPEQEFFRQSIRTFSLPYQWISYGSIQLKNLFGLIHPFIFGDQLSYAGPPPNYAEQAMFIGRITLVLAAVAIVLGIPKLRSLKNLQKDEKTYLWIIFALITLFAIWVSLGPNAPLDIQYILWKLVPMYHYLRIPPRHLVLFVFGMSMLAGLGLEALISIKAIRFHKQKFIELIIVGTIIAELVPFAQHFMRLTPLPETIHDKPLVATFQSASSLDTTGGPYRLLQNFGVWVSARDSLDFDSVASYGIYSVTGYDPSILRNYYEFIDAASGNAEPSILSEDVQVPYLNVWSPYADVLNFKYLMVLTPYDPAYGTKGKFTFVSENLARNYRVYENTTAFPRFYFVPNIVSLENRAEVAETIRKNTVDPKTTVLALQKDISSFPGSISSCPVGEDAKIHITQYNPNTITMLANVPCDGYITSSEVMYPGWDAYVDGVKTELFEGNLAFRTVKILKGNHTIVMTYSPRIFLWGLGLSILSAIGVISWVKMKKQTD
jgi:hypothetical protein